MATERFTLLPVAVISTTFVRNSQTPPTSLLTLSHTTFISVEWNWSVIITEKSSDRNTTTLGLQLSQIFRYFLQTYSYGKQKPPKGLNIFKLNENTNMEYYLALSSMLHNFAFTTLSWSLYKTYKLNSKWPPYCIPRKPCGRMSSS